MWMSSPLHTRPLFFFLLHDVSTSRPKRDCLLFVARHTAVALTRNAPLSKAPRPRDLFLRDEPSGVFLSRFWLSSSRSLGHCLLLGQRSRMNFFSDLIRSLFHQHHSNPYTQLTGYRYNGDSRSNLARVFAANRAEKFPKLPVLSDRRPRGLDDFASQPLISSAGDRSPIRSLTGGVLGGHQAQKATKLADVVKLSPIANAGQKLAGGNPADAGKRHQILHTLRQFGIVLAVTANLSYRLKDLLLVKLQAVEQLIQFKAHRPRAGKLTEFILHSTRPLTAGGSRGKLDPFEEQQRFNPLLHPHQLAHQHIAQLSEMAKLAIHGSGNMNALQLSPTKTLRQRPTVKPIGLHSLSWRFGNHRRRGDQARVALGHNPIIQSIPCGSSLVHKGHLLIGKVLANVVKQVLCTIRHAQGLKESVMISKGHRDASLVHVQSRKHIVVPRNKCLASHRSASLIQWLKFPPLYLLLSTRGEPRHPSYKSQHERNFLSHFKSLSVRPELVEGGRRVFHQ